MKLLLDTQAFIWFVENDIQLPPKVKSELEKSDILLSFKYINKTTPTPPFKGGEKLQKHTAPCSSPL